jgi:hypothetical protein
MGRVGIHEWIKRSQDEAYYTESEECLPQPGEDNSDRHYTRYELDVTTQRSVSSVNVVACQVICCQAL